jgi:putative transposase
MFQPMTLANSVTGGNNHRAVKRITRPMLGFKSFAAAQDTLVGIELMHMIKKRQLVVKEGDQGRTAAELFYSLAA